MSGEKFELSYSSVEKEKSPEEIEGLKSIYHATLLNKWGNEVPSGDIVLKDDFFGWDKPDATFMLGASSNQRANEVSDLLNTGMFIKVIACEDEIKYAPDPYIEAGKTLRFVGVQGSHNWESTYGKHTAPVVVFITDRAIDERKNKNNEVKI